MLMVAELCLHPSSGTSTRSGQQSIYLFVYDKSRISTNSNDVESMLSEPNLDISGECLHLRVGMFLPLRAFFLLALAYNRERD